VLNLDTQTDLAHTAENFTKRKENNQWCAGEISKVVFGSKVRWNGMVLSYFSRVWFGTKENRAARVIQTPQVFSSCSFLRLCSLRRWPAISRHLRADVWLISHRLPAPSLSLAGAPPCPLPFSLQKRWRGRRSGTQSARCQRCGCRSCPPSTYAHGSVH
jgi:hypothetical protein